MKNIFPYCFAMLAIIAAVIGIAAQETQKPVVPVNPGESLFIKGYAEHSFRDIAMTRISIQTRIGEINIDLKTGAVDLPKDAKMDLVAVEFWKAVAKAFPEAKKQIIAEEKTK